MTHTITPVDTIVNLSYPTKTIRKILKDLNESGQSLIGSMMTLDELDYYSPSQPDALVYTFRSRIKLPITQHKVDATAYYYDDVVLYPTNEQRTWIVEFFRGTYIYDKS
jgi:hypothetical protein